MKIENIKPEGYVMKGVYTPAKKLIWEIPI